MGLALAKALEKLPLERETHSLGATDAEQVEIALARTIADILQARGELDEALRIRREVRCRLPAAGDAGGGGDAGNRRHVAGRANWTGRASPRSLPVFRRLGRGRRR
jgi:hypothetical protein